MEITQNVPMSKEEQLVIFRKILVIKNMLDDVKPLYEQLDELNMQLSESLPDGYIYVDKDVDKVYKFVDNFASKNTAFKATGVKRFETSMEPVEKYEKRLERAAKKAAKEAAKGL